MTARQQTFLTAVAWRWAAACAGTDPELFFAPLGENAVTGTRRIGAAKRICAACPVRAACLAHALNHPEETEYGIWGGHTEAELDQLRTGFRQGQVA